MHNVIQLPDDPGEREAKIREKEEWCKKWVFGAMEKVHKGVAEYGWARLPGWTRGRIVVPVNVLAPLVRPQKILSIANGKRNREYHGQGGAGQRWLEWAVEKFKDVWVHEKAEEAMEIWKLVRAGGMKRLLGADITNEEDIKNQSDQSTNRRPMKKAKGLPKERPGWTRCETPLPPLPVAREDYPVVPTSVFSIRESWRERSTSETLYERNRSSSPTVVGHSPSPPPPSSPRAPAFGDGVKTRKIPSWLLEGDWLELASRSRFEVVN
ncbi:hypothetical protein NP233_g12507 [Leucocoprinus birnbaumii]|uniref:Uncharacterized protein n=1 Tax=Leucocoprinus birnbaumii TaxID=56174 RepID=A0AAD5YN02_9AGAR|nr:hypothetical protein NP233_g12507 [Leucocoprinus birnbaumii]